MPISTTNLPSQRLPAPSLFVAPPSRNTSTLDLLLHKSPTSTSQPRSPLSRADTATARITPSASIPSPSSPLPDDYIPTHPSALRASSPHTSLFPPPPPDPHDDNAAPAARLTVATDSSQHNRARRPTAVLDAHWAALQSTLSDIELSASGTSHVFGPNHANALEDLRTAQVALARAWGPRGEDESSEGFGGPGGTGLGSGLLYGSVRGKKEVGEEKKAGSLERSETKTTATTTGASARTKGASSEHGSGSGNESASKQERKQSLAGPSAVGGRDADADLDAAEQRRKESDAYFKRVKEGVEEVVRKLEGVSKAMRNVELESREIWGDAESEGSTELDDTSLMTRTMSPILN